MRNLLASAALAAVFSCLAAPQAQDGDPFWAATAPEREARAALRVLPRNNMTFVDAEVEGVRCTLLVDTGATHTTFDKAFVERNMPGTELVPVAMAADSNVEGAPRYMRVGSLKIGEAEFRDFGAMALDMSHLHSALGERADGIIGMSTLGRVPCLLSLSSGELVFEPGRDRRDGFDRPVKRSLSDPMSILLPVKFGEREFEVLVDSASSMTFLSGETRWPVAGEAARLSAVDINGAAGLRPQAGERGVIPVGEGLEASPLVVAEPMNRIGADVLSRYDMLIAGRYVFFRPGCVPPRPEPPLPPPGIRIVDMRRDEKPVAVEKSEAVVEENAFFKRVRATFAFTNPNPRVMAGEFEFPIPDGAFVCGYSLQIGDEMVPGVVCGKEKARVAFENEVRKGVDPGIVEQVKGNIWKTRIFPLNPNTPRRAEVVYVAPKDGVEEGVVCERDGDDVFVASAGTAAAPAKASEAVPNFARGTIIWDASMSAKPSAAAWRKKLESLPEKGEWTLVVFRDRPEEARSFASRAELCAAVDALDYDGGTDIGRAVAAYAAGGSPTLLFSDEIDTMGLCAPNYEDVPGLAVASRGDAPARTVEVRRLAKGEKVPDGAEAKEGGLLASVWAARRMQDLASQADARRDEFLALGRRYGVAGPGLSLIVLETLEQWLEHKIEPPANLAVHDEWVRRRAADDDPIAEKKAKAEHEQQLLKYWEERVKWWKSPKPPRSTPKSGVFDAVADAVAAPVRMAANAVAGSRERGLRREAEAEPALAVGAMDEAVAAEPPPVAAEEGKVAPGSAGSDAAPTVKLRPWDPKTPYIDALGGAAKGEEYKVYLKEREAYGGSPAFYLDCAGWFYKAGDRRLADRIISNLAEFKLEDAALWRSMGWRAREAGSGDLAVLAFRKALALRGEEGQSRRDLAVVLAECGKETRNAAMLEEAMKLFSDAAFRPAQRRSGRRGNDFQVSVVALEELNGLVSWVNDVEWPDGGKPAVPEFDAAYRRDLPVKLRIVMSWDADETDIDLHVLEPNGEEAYYGHRRTAEGGFVSEDVTTGYGPEEYLKKDLEEGVYKVLSNYYASHQTALTGATTVSATVYTDWGTSRERHQILTMRLDKPKSKHLIGEVEL